MTRANDLPDLELIVRLWQRESTRDDALRLADLNLAASKPTPVPATPERKQAA